MKISEGKSQSVNRSIENIMVKRWTTNRQTMVHKILHRKLKMIVGICSTCKVDGVKYQTYLVQSATLQMTCFEVRHFYGGWLRPCEKKKICSFSIISCSHNLLFCSHKKYIFIPQHTILFPQHIILFPQYIILFPQHILFPQYIIINTN